LKKVETTDEPEAPMLHLIAVNDNGD